MSFDMYSYQNQNQNQNVNSIPQLPIHRLNSQMSLSHPLIELDPSKQHDIVNTPYRNELFYHSSSVSDGNITTSDSTTESSSSSSSMNTSNIDFWVDIDGMNIPNSHNQGPENNNINVKHFYLFDSSSDFSSAETSNYSLTNSDNLNSDSDEFYSSDNDQNMYENENNRETRSITRGVPCFTSTKYILTKIQVFLIECFSMIFDLNSLPSMKENGVSINIIPKTHVSCNKKLLQFVQITKVLSIVQALLLSNNVITVRELYYTCENLFTNCSQCDSIVKRISEYFHVPRHSLAIVGSSKGLLSGNFRYRTPLGVDEYSEWISVESIPGGFLQIPGDILLVQNLQIETTADFILVVEKEAVFQRLVNSEVADNGIIITGKGFPDLATRAMTQKIASLHNLTVYCVVDYNPSGIHIMLTYRDGGSSRIEGQTWAISSLKWLGIKSQDFVRINMDKITSIFDIPLNSENHSTNSESLNLEKSPITEGTDLNFSNWGNDAMHIQLTEMKILTSRDLAILHNLTTKINDDILYISNSLQTLETLNEENTTRIPCTKEELEFKTNLIRELSIMRQNGRKLEIEALNVFGLNYLSDEWLPTRLIDENH